MVVSITLEEKDSDDFKFIRINKKPIYLNRNEDDEIIEDVTDLKGKNLMAINAKYLAVAVKSKLRFIKIAELDEYLSKITIDDDLKFDLGISTDFESEIIYVTVNSNGFWIGLVNGQAFELRVKDDIIKTELLFDLGEGPYKLSSDGSFCLKNGILACFKDDTLTLHDSDVVDFEYKKGLCLVVLKKDELIVQKTTFAKTLKLSDIDIQEKDFYYVQILNENFVQLFYTVADEENETIPDYLGMESVIIKIDGPELEVINTSIIASADAFVEREFESYAVDLQNFLKEYKNITVVSSSRSTSAQLLTEPVDSNNGNLILENSTDDQYNITLPMNENDDDTTTKGLVLNYWSKNAELVSELLALPIENDVPLIYLLNSELELFCYVLVHLSAYKSGSYVLEESKNIAESRLTIKEDFDNANEEKDQAEETFNDLPPLDHSDGAEVEFEIISETENSLASENEIANKETEDIVEKQDEAPDSSSFSIFKSMGNIVSQGKHLTKTTETLSNLNSPFSSQKNLFGTKDDGSFSNFGSNTFANFSSDNQASKGGLTFAGKFKNNLGFEGKDSKESNNSDINKNDIPASTFTKASITTPESFTPNVTLNQVGQNETTNLNTTYNTVDITEDADDGSWVEVLDNTAQHHDHLNSDHHTDMNSSIIEKNETENFIKQTGQDKNAEICEVAAEVKPKIVSAGTQADADPKKVAHISVFAHEKLFVPKTLNEAYPYPVLESLYSVNSEEIFNHKFENDDAGIVVFAKIINIVENELRAIKANAKIFDKFVLKQSERTFEKANAELLTDPTVHWRLGELKQFNKLFSDELDPLKLSMTALKDKDESLVKILTDAFDLRNNINTILEKLEANEVSSTHFATPTNSEKALLESNGEMITNSKFKLDTIKQILKFIKITIACGKDFSQIQKTELEQCLLESKANDEIIGFLPPISNVISFNNNKISLSRRKQLISKREQLASFLT
ncbi:hypothetical protein QEN19_004248 [Hanseniaspora menglaensis]